MGTLFFIFLTITTFSFVAIFLNMINMYFKNDIDLLQSKRFMVFNIVCGLLYVLGGVATFITGIAWLISTIK